METRLAHGRFYGETTRSSDVGGLVLSETVYRPGVRIPRHSHEHAYFCLILRGSYSETFGRMRRECRPMTVAFHPSGELHSEQFHSEPVRSFNVEVEPGWSERLREHSRFLDAPMQVESGWLASLALRMYREFTLMDDLSSLAVEGLAIEVVVEASRQARRKHDWSSRKWLRQAREVIHERFSESLTLGAIAESVGVHPVHLATEFRKAHRCTVGQYLRQLRVEYACRQLSTSMMPLAEIAIAAGFTDQSHLSKTFKYATGMTPARYRAIFRSTLSSYKS